MEEYFSNFIFISGGINSSHIHLGRYLCLVMCKQRPLTKHRHLTRGMCEELIPPDEKMNMTNNFNCHSFLETNHQTSLIFVVLILAQSLCVRTGAEGHLHFSLYRRRQRVLYVSNGTNGTLHVLAKTKRRCVMGLELEYVMISVITC